MPPDRGGLTRDFHGRFWAVRESGRLVKLPGMARANQRARGGGIFHVTHPCHHRAFLLKFARDRDAYRCVCYIELNVVRAGVVSHPRQREWVGYHEIMGQRRRDRLLHLERSCWR